MTLFRINADIQNEEPEVIDDTSYSEDITDLDMPELNDEKVTAERTPASVKINNIPLWSRLWLNLGAGVNSNLNSQTLNDKLNFDYQSLATPSYSGALGLYLTNNIALEATYQNTTDTLEEINDILIDQDYNLVNYGIEGIYSFGRGLKSKGSNWYLRLGAKSNDLPILEAYPISKDVKLLSGNFLTGSK